MSNSGQPNNNLEKPLVTLEDIARTSGERQQRSLERQKELKRVKQQRFISAVGSRWPNLAGRRKKVERPVLKSGRRPLASDRSPLPPPVPTSSTYQPVKFQPPNPNTTLQQQLDAFTQALGYASGDRLYVRALLPKNLSDELAVSHRLKFEIEESSKKRLIPNTRRGYLTVGSWEFTHIRKDKEPAVYADGLAKLAELNREGRGIYFVVNPGGEKNRDIMSAHSVFWESDDLSKPEQIEQAQRSGLTLGAVVETQKSIHCYSPLVAPITNLDEWRKLQERLIQHMESDPAIRNSSRMMRLPGFHHVRTEKTAQDERLVFTPVVLRHIDLTAKSSVEDISGKLPQWDEQRWGKTSQKRRESGDRFGEAAAPTSAADNPWDIRNFAQYLNGDHDSRDGWLKVQCPHHGGEGHSGDSLAINEATGQFTCHGGCDTKDVYRAAWELAEERGWVPPEKKTDLGLANQQPRATPKPILKVMAADKAGQKERRPQERRSKGFEL